MRGVLSRWARVRESQAGWVPAQILRPIPAAGVEPLAPNRSIAPEAPEAGSTILAASWAAEALILDATATVSAAEWGSASGTRCTACGIRQDRDDWRANLHRNFHALGGGPLGWDAV